MNESRIEQLLRKAPRPAPPSELEARLKSDIRLRSRSPAKRTGAWLTLLLRRWVPVGACVVTAAAVAVQGSRVLQLKRENERLRSSLAALEQAAQGTDEAQSRSLQSELAQLHQDNQERARLPAEISKLQLEVMNAQNTLKENNRKQEEKAQAQAAAAAENVEKQKAEAMEAQCVNNLKQLGVAARLWIVDNENTPNAGRYPKSFTQMKDEVGSPKVFFCPVDSELQRNATWENVDQGRSSYIFVTPQAREIDVDVVVFRCPHHGIVALADGSVQKLRDFKIGEGNRLERNR